MSSSLHNSELSYRVGRAIVFDEKRSLRRRQEADRLLTRDYRKGFEIPSRLNSRRLMNTKRS